MRDLCFALHLLNKNLFTGYSFFDITFLDKENKLDRLQKKQATPPDHNVIALTQLFMCNKCTKSYRLKHSLTRHIKYECGMQPKYPCMECNRRFKHNYDLKMHIKSQHSDKRLRTILEKES